MQNLVDSPTQPRFSKELPADRSEQHSPRQVYGACFSYVNPRKPSAPQLLHKSSHFLNELGVSVNDENTFTEVMSGKIPFQNFRPYAMCYGGHQFGHWAGQLGDGRAINIAEAELNGSHYTFQLKGAGLTPYSRTADGLAVLRSSVREYLCSEAMHHLGVPTTRALSLVKTGDGVTRDMLYNGNPQLEQGAVVCRVSPSFIRFGNFEIFAARQDQENLQKLVDFTIRHHYPHLGQVSKESYLQFFEEVAKRTLNLMLHWQRVGFVHGVMNTDNMSILGLTIDYGPYGWLEDYDPDWTPNTTDAQHRRYRFGQQPNIALWNIAQLANALYPLIGEAEPLQRIFDETRDEFGGNYHRMMCNKLGLLADAEVPAAFIGMLENLLREAALDMTIFFREISSHINSFDKLEQAIQKASYLQPDALAASSDSWKQWYESYQTLLGAENRATEERIAAMKTTNPKYVLRNYMAQLAIDKAETGNYNLIDELYTLLLKPYDEQPEMEKWYAKRPDWAKHKVGCSMLSCSS